MSALARVIAIVGPTASGKSALAEEIALELGSQIVSVDSMQIYRGMGIGTAKVPPAERRVPLLMVDVCDPDESYSVERFQRDARICVDNLIAKDMIPVLCGGTGLYLNAVVNDMSFPQGSDEDERRHELEALAEEIGPLGMHDKLTEIDPESAALVHPNNIRRVIRAIELAEDGGSYARQLETLHKQNPVYDAHIWGLSVPREKLYTRIDQRVDEMFDAGLVDEVKALAEAGFAETHTARQAIGYKEILEALEGSCSMEEARETIKTRTRRYAKRQLSWFRNDGRVRWIDLEDCGVRGAVDAILSDIRS